MEAILIAVRALEAKDSADELRRAGQAERTRRSRAMKRDGNVTVTAQSQAAPAPFSPSDKERSPTPPKETNSPLTPTPGEPRERFANPVLVLQSVVDPMVARDFADHCAQAGKRLTAQSAQGVVATLRQGEQAGWPGADVLRFVMAQGWTTGWGLDWLRNRDFMPGHAAAGTGPDWAKWCEVYFADGTWSPSLGPKPDEAGCKAPTAIVDQARKARAA